MDPLRVAIAAGLYRNPQGTQINFHVDNLFGGNTVVLSGLRGEPCPHDKPVFIYSKRNADAASTRQVVFEKFEKMGNLLRYRTNKVPCGQTRQNMLDFLRDQRVDVILSEFGNIAPRLTPIARAANVPIFTYFRGIDASAHLKNPLRLSSYKRAMPHIAGVFAVSQFLLDNLAAAGVHHPNAYVVPSGVDTSLFCPAEKKPLSCVAVGRLIEKTTTIQPT